MALSGSANKRLVSRARRERRRARSGCPARMRRLIAAAPMDAGAARATSARRVAINVAFLRHLLGGRLPAGDLAGEPRRERRRSGSALNVNGDDAAAAIAVAMRRDELLLVADVAGVMRDGAVIASLTPDEARALIADGTAAAGCGPSCRRRCRARRWRRARPDFRHRGDRRSRRGTVLTAIGERLRMTAPTMTRDSTRRRFRSARHAVPRAAGAVARERAARELQARAGGFRRAAKACISIDAEGKRVSRLRERHRGERARLRRSGPRSRRCTPPPTD